MFRRLTYNFICLFLIFLGIKTQAQPVLSTDPEPTYIVEARTRNGGTGYEAVLFTPGNPSPGTPSTQLNPTGAPAWSYGNNHAFQFYYVAAIGISIWSIDFNRDGDFFDPEETTFSISTTLAGQTFSYINIFLQGNNVPARSATVNNFTINGVNFGSFVSAVSAPTTQLFEDLSGNFGDIEITGSVNFSGGVNTERPRFYIQLGSLVALPSQLIEFSAQKEGNSRLLKWVTENEVNTKDFIVERSLDGIVFQTIGTVKAKNVPGTNRYKFTDTEKITGNLFYRLKSVDIDARFQYSKLLRINASIASEPAKVYPNPARGSFSLTLPNAKPANVKMVNISGKVMWEKTITSQATSLDISMLTPGIYFVMIYQDGQTNNLRLLIQ